MQPFLIILNLILSLLTVFNSIYLLSRFQKEMIIGGYAFLLANCVFLGGAIYRIIHNFNNDVMTYIVTFFYICYFIGSTSFARTVHKITKQ